MYKEKVVPLHAMMAYRKGRCIAVPFLGWWSAAYPACPAPREETQCLFNRWLGGSQTWSGHF